MMFPFLWTSHTEKTLLIVSTGNEFVYGNFNGIYDTNFGNCVLEVEREVRTLNKANLYSQSFLDLTSTRNI